MTSTTKLARITSPESTADGGKGGAQPPEPAWLTRYRTRAIDNAAELVTDSRRDAVHFALGWAQGTIRVALQELAHPEPDTERLRDGLMDGYASAATILGDLDKALAELVEIDVARKRMAPQGPVTL
ncbi:MAG: hypothetical protein NUW01_12110 [Gemmatimonadaceae bacterium]|nr:hypothetical protein [Gemmatimonadaceae bacterium]